MIRGERASCARATTIGDRTLGDSCVHMRPRLRSENMHSCVQQRRAKGFLAYTKWHMIFCSRQSMCWDTSWTKRICLVANTNVESAFHRGAFTWFDLLKLSFRCVKSILGKLQTVFDRHWELWSRRGRRRSRYAVLTGIGGVCRSVLNNSGG